MSDGIQGQDLAARLTRTGGAMGRLAEDDTLFRATVDAFRSEDAESFSRLLDRLQAGLFCEDICRWFCSKECVLECVELCGPPTGEIGVEQIPQFAELIAKITSDEELIERLADAIERRDPATFKALVKELKIERFCHLLCHWACGVRCRLICEVLCAPRPVPQKQFVAELALAGAAIGRLANNAQQLGQVVAAAVASNCEILSGLLGGFNDCFLICEWICSWRCALVCLPFCRPFPPIVDTSIEEIRGFAQLSGRLAASKDAFPRLLAAVQSEDAKAFAALVQEFKIDRYCLQLCHWICGEVCGLLCFCVCPQPETIPLFTHVGNYHVDPIFNDFKADGTTSDHGWAFTQTIDLKGILPDGTAPDALEYRFTYQNLGGGGVNPITGAMIPSATVIGQLEYWEWDSTLLIWVVRSHDYFVNNPGAVVNIQQQFGPALTVGVDTDTDPDGWIQVPRENQLFQGGQGRFVPTGVLAKLDTTKLTNEIFDLTVIAPPLPLKAGDAMPAAQKSVKPVFQINFEARKVVGHAGVSANTLNKIALSNTTYTYNRHPDWAGSPPPITSVPVLSLDIVELITGGGCNPLSTDLHALFTAYHPYLATCQVYIEGPLPVPPAVNPPISADGEADSPIGGQAFNISGLKPCAYILWLTATLNLTDGYVQVYGTFNDHIAFCKH
jgi:hypothetical protein